MSITYPGRPNRCSGHYVWRSTPAGHRSRLVPCEGQATRGTSQCESCRSKERESREGMRRTQVMNAFGAAPAGRRHAAQDEDDGGT